MGLDIFGAGGIAGLFKGIVDKIVPDANAKLELTQAHDAEVSAAAQQAAQITANQYTADIDLLKKQLDVNLAEASNANIFVSGARPFAMWGLTVTVILLSFGLLWLVHEGKNIGEYFEVYFALVSFLMALFGVHTVERHRGVAPEQPDGPNVPRSTSVAESLLPTVEKIAGKFLRA